MYLRLFWYKRHHLCYSSSSSLSRSWGPNPNSETGHMEWARRVTAQGKAPTSSPNVPSSWAFPTGVYNRSSCTSTNRTSGQHTRRVFQAKWLVRFLWHAKSHTLVPLTGWLTWPTDSPIQTLMTHLSFTVQKSDPSTWKVILLRGMLICKSQATLACAQGCEMGVRAQPRTDGSELLTQAAVFSGCGNKDTTSLQMRAMDNLSRVRGHWAHF